MSGSGVGKITAIVMAVVGLVAFLAIFPTILQSTYDSSNSTYITDFSGVQSIVNLIPLIAVVGGLAVAALIARSATKGRD